MKHSKFTKILAVVMSFVLLVSAVSVTASLLDEPIEVNITVESAEAANVTMPTVKSLSSGIRSVLNNVAQTLVEASRASINSAKKEIAEKTEIDVEVTENAVISGKEYNLTSIGGIVKALVNVRSILELKYIGLACLENIFTGLLNKVAGLIKTPSTFVDVDKFVSEDFYAGTEAFLDAPAENAVWSLGYSQASLVPDDINSRNYYLGGYLMQYIDGNKVEDVIDDMKVRVIALSDNSGRGTAIFATIDSIGISNKDIRVIRNKLAEYAQANNIVSINVFSTHCHSSIDTQGLWNPLLPVMLNNGFVKLTGKGELETGTDEKFMELLTNRTVNAIKEAYEDMEKGELTYSEYDASRYYDDDRPSADDVKSVVNRLGRFVFTPYSKTEATIIVNGGAHPSITGLKTSDGKSTGRELSADYVATMEEVINAAGYNFMFFNGAISGVYPNRGYSNDGLDLSHRYQVAQRYGYELGLHVLYMTESEAEIANDSFAKAALEKYLPADYSETGKGTLWYEGKVASEEVGVEPVLNIRLKEILCEVTNPIILAVGKLGFTNSNIVVDENGACYYVTEIGYLEIGDKNVAMLPGEISPDLFTGLGGYTAAGSVTQTEFAYPTFPEIAEDENLLVFGLANDAIGYVVPDNDYCNCIVDGEGHYQETISIGGTVASTLAKSFRDLLDSVK